MCASLAVCCGCLDEAPFVCYSVRYSIECEYWQLWSVKLDTAAFL